MKRRHNFLDINRRDDDFDGDDNEQRRWSSFLDEFRLKWCCNLILNSQNIIFFEVHWHPWWSKFHAWIFGRLVSDVKIKFRRNSNIYDFFPKNFLKDEYPIFFQRFNPSQDDLLHISGIRQNIALQSLFCE